MSGNISSLSFVARHDTHDTHDTQLKRSLVVETNKNTDGDWIKLSQLVAVRSAYDVKLHARVFWQSPAAAAAEEQQAAQQAGLKREFVQPSPTVEARKKHRPVRFTLFLFVFLLFLFLIMGRAPSLLAGFARGRSSAEERGRQRGRGGR